MALNRIIISIIVLLYIGNYPVLSKLYPNLTEDYEAFLSFYKLRNIIYEMMFFWSFVLFYRVGEKLLKALATFGVVMTAGSLIDKAIFNISQYLMSDIILIVVGALVSIKVYKENV